MLEYVILIKELSIALLFCLGAYSIDSWRREHVGRRRLDLAEEVLSQFYEARDAISHIRCPAGFEGETAAVQKQDNESEADHHARKTASVVFVRYNSHREMFSKLHATRYRFMAQFGAEAARPFDNLHAIVSEVLSAGRALAMLWPIDYHRTEDQKQHHAVAIEKYEAIFWEHDQDDALRKKVDDAVGRIESTCRSEMKGRGTLFGLLNRSISHDAS